MIKTSICIYPSDKGQIDSSFSFTNEYCRICLGVLPKERQRIQIFYGKDQIFQPQMELDQFIKTDFNLSSDEKADLMKKGTRSLLSNEPNTFNVGRLMIISDPNGIIIPEGVNSNDTFLHFATSLQSTLMNRISDKRDPIKFHRLYFELILFSEESFGSHIDVMSKEDNSSHVIIHVTVRHPNDSEKYAQILSYNHLKLSLFKMDPFRIYFLNIFEQDQVNIRDIKNVKYQNPEDLSGPVEISYPCVILNKDMPVLTELQKSDIIFEDEHHIQWLLSLHNKYCFLSKLGPAFSDNVIKKFSFKADPTKNRLIQEMPQKLIISPDGNNWPFSRSKPSPGIKLITRINEFKDKSFVLFSPHFINNQKARSIIKPILDAVAKFSPTRSDAEEASKGMSELFNTLLNAPQEILQDVVVNDMLPTDSVMYATLLQGKRMSLLGEIKVILCWYEKAPGSHGLILQTFKNMENMANSRYPQQQ